MDATQQSQGDASPAAAHAKYDLLTVNTDGLLDLEAPELGLLPGSPAAEDLPTEVDAVTKLLVAYCGAEAPATKQRAGRRTEKGGAAAAGAAAGPAAAAPAVFGHSRRRAHEIAYDNSRLVQRLVTVAAAKPKSAATSAAHDRHIANVMASTLASRRLDEERLMRANLALYRRLQAVRPSKDVDTRRLETDWKRSRGFLGSMRAAPEPALKVPGAARHEAWNDRWQARPSTC